MLAAALLGLLTALSTVTSAQAAVNGPVISQDFADPSILHVGATWFAYASNNNVHNIQLAMSTDLQSWQVSGGDALPTLGVWATTGKTWAPDVIDHGDGTFVMYYTAHSINPDTQCIGAATATNPAGPFTPQPRPLACPAAQGGAIDPDGFTDSDGARYVVYKVDGNSLAPGGPCGNPNGTESTPIELQRLTADGLTPQGGPTTILDRGPADGPLIEAPSLIKHGGSYVLFFSSNCFDTDLYDISYATSPGIAGPYAKAGAPLLVTDSSRGLFGPGSADISADGSTLVFHGRISPNFDPFVRGMFVASVTWNGDNPAV